jgi:hypothetical protein
VDVTTLTDQEDDIENGGAAYGRCGCNTASLAAPLGSTTDPHAARGHIGTNSPRRSQCAPAAEGKACRDAAASTARKLDFARAARAAGPGEGVHADVIYRNQKKVHPEICGVHSCSI